MKLLLVLFSEHINHPFEIVSQSVFRGAKEMESAKQMGKKPHNYLAKQGQTQHKNKSEEEKLQSQRHKCRVNNAGLEIYVAVWCDSKKRSLIANTQLHTLSQYIHTLSTIYNIVVIITIILYFAYRLLYTCTESATVHTIQD